MASNIELIAIVGPTASGKTGLALELAERYGGEIICADSRTIYKGMDVGTAKPTIEEQARVPHWGLDLVEPNETFSVADFQRHALDAIANIRARGKLPILVGGTGLYVDAVVYNFNLGPAADTKQRQELEQLTTEQLMDYCHTHNITLPENYKNKRHLVRAIERKSISTIGRTPLSPRTIIVGIATDRRVLRTRIVARTEQLFESGVEKEATILGKKYGWKSEAMTGNIYKLLRQHLSGSLTREELKEKFTTLDYQLAKRQMTWFRRNPDIMWTTLTEANRYITKRLVSE
jgi:tRNA dimethylallyltransferase